MRTLTTAALGLLTATALATGTVSAAPAGRPTTPAAQLLLTQPDFPAGYRVVALSAAERSDVAQVVGDVVTGMRITPPQCGVKDVSPDVLRSEMRNVSMVIAVNKPARRSLSQALLPKTVDLGKVRAAGAGPCSKVHVRLDRAGEVGPIDLDVSVARATVPGVPAGAAVVVGRTTGTVGTGPKAERVSEEQLIGYAVERGYTVQVSGSASNGGAVDRAAFAQTLTRAVNKVRTAN